MTTAEAIKILAGELTEELVVATTGYTCRDLQAARDRKENFYMIGSMGIAASIGLGVALTRPERRVVIFDGDGSVLMALGTLPMVGTLRPNNFAHIVFDNEVFASTGNQPTYSSSVDLDRLAQSSGYPMVSRAQDPQDLKARWQEIQSRLRSQQGPAFLLVKCRPNEAKPAPRVAPSPQELTNRFMEAIR